MIPRLIDEDGSGTFNLSTVESAISAATTIRRRTGSTGGRRSTRRRARRATSPSRTAAPSTCLKPTNRSSGGRHSWAGTWARLRPTPPISPSRGPSSGSSSTTRSARSTPWRARSAVALSLRVGPNPVRTRASVMVTTEAAGDMRLVLVDVLGREVAVLADGLAPAGEHRAEVDAAGLAAGVYVVVLDAEGDSGDPDADRRPLTPPASGPRRADRARACVRWRAICPVGRLAVAFSSGSPGLNRSCAVRFSSLVLVLPLAATAQPSAADVSRAGAGRGPARRGRRAGGALQHRGPVLAWKAGRLRGAEVDRRQRHLRAGLWVSGVVDGGLRFAGSTYGPWEFWPGPASPGGATSAARCRASTGSGPSARPTSTSTTRPARPRPTSPSGPSPWGAPFYATPTWTAARARASRR